jgi:integrase
MPVLTPIAVASYKPHKVRREIPDDRATGLFLIVQPTGAKSWAVRLRRPNKKSAKLTLGKVNLTNEETADKPELGGTLTLRQARLLATQIDNQRASGLDVVAERKAEKNRQRDAAVDRAANTFGAALPQFFIQHRTRKWNTRPRRWREDAATLGLKYPPGTDDPAVVKPEVIAGSLADVWADKPIADIDKYVVDAAIEEASEQSNGRARKMYSALRVFFGKLPLKLRPAINPVFGVDRPGTPASRKRALDKTEIVTFWKACNNIGGAFGPMFKLLLLTGCRERECAGMTCAELGENNVWEVPSSRTKNHLEFLVPLPPQALAVINSAPEIKDKAGYVFSTTGGERPVSGFSKAKAALDKEMAKIAGQPIERWRIHDLRRTFSTILNESPEDGGLGCQPHHVEALLNHVSGSAKGGVAGTYNKAKYLSEKRVALQRWSAHIENLVADRKAKVLPMRKRKKGSPDVRLT